MDSAAHDPREMSRVLAEDYRRAPARALARYGRHVSSAALGAVLDA